MNKTLKRTTETRTYYEFDWTSYYCIDYGGLGHDAAHDRYQTVVDVDTDREALAEATKDRYRGKYRCSGYGCSGNGMVNQLHSITKVTVVTDEDGTQTTTRKQLAIPYATQCPCGRIYWAALGEKACHKLIPQEVVPV